MKRRIQAFCCLMAAGLFFAAITGCKGPQGPAGPSGPGNAALEGFAPGIKCATCHNPDQDSTYYVAGREYQWAQSKHANGGDSERNSAACAGCHTTEGFIQRMSGQAVTNQNTPSPPGCFACHSPHTRGNFTLRDSTPVLLKSQI